MLTASTVLGTRPATGTATDGSERGRERHREPTGAGGRPSPLWWLVMLPVVLSTFDLRGVLRGTSQIRFAVAVAVVVVAAVVAKHCALPRRTTPRGRAQLWEWVGAVLILTMLAGSFAGRVFGSTVASSLSAAIPLTLMLVPLSRLPRERDVDGSVVVRLRRVLCLYVAVAVLVRLTPLLPGASVGAFSHEKAYLITGAIAAAWLTGSQLLLGCLVVAGIALYAQYPAATYPAAGLAMLLALAVTSPAPGRRRVAARVGAVILAAGAVAGARLDALQRYLATYFDAVGKGNNVDFRVVLFRAAEERIRNSPWVGSLFAGETTVPIPPELRVVVNGHSIASVEPHNDVLQIWMLGGLLGMAIYLAWILAINVAAIRFCARLGPCTAVTLARSILVVVDSFFVVGLFNPIVIQLGPALILAGMLLGLRLLIRTCGRGRPVGTGESG